MEREGSREDRYFVLSAILAGLAAWTKNEGIVYALFNLTIIIFILRGQPLARKGVYLLSYLGIIGLIISPWWILKTWLGLKNIYINSERLSFTFIVNNFSNIGSTFKTFVEMSIRGYFNAAWIMFLFFGIRNRRRVQTPSYFYLTLAIFLHVLLAVTFFLLSPVEQYLWDAFPRLLLAPTVLCLIYVVLIQKEYSSE